jgi:hypothetical protein
MTLPRRQRRLLRSIGEQLSSTDPQLAGRLQLFGELGGREPMPVREQLPAGISRFWPALWAALGASAGLFPDLYPAADRSWLDMPRATFAPGLPAPCRAPLQGAQGGRARAEYRERTPGRLRPPPRGRAGHALSRQDSWRRARASPESLRPAVVTLAAGEGAEMRLFRFRALVIADPPDPPRPGHACHSDTRRLMVHARHIGPPPGDRYFPVMMTWDDQRDLRTGEKAIVTLTVADQDAPAYLGAGQTFTLWGGGSGHGIITRQVFTDGSPS